ncbi:hypothetical protein ACFQH5_20160 [Halomonas salifodinae]|uniref:Uncharacterized protein n=1 Tax=Halomonas salifodinae TaxID=438745 RepID=A0ABW2F0V0_9GAMM
MSAFDYPWYVDAAAFLIFSGTIGLFVMTVMPSEWQNPHGWIIVSFIGLPLFFVALAILIAFPGLLFGALFLCGVLAVGK